MGDPKDKTLITTTGTVGQAPVATPLDAEVEKTRAEAGVSTVKAEIDEAARTKAGQRSINRIWEYTQAVVAILVTIASLVATLYLLTIGDMRNAAFMFLSNIFFMILATYFSRTNHTKTGGVGSNDTGR